jgi:hypothetical protein
MGAKREQLGVPIWVRGAMRGKAALRCARIADAGGAPRFEPTYWFATPSFLGGREAEV